MLELFLNLTAIYFKTVIFLCLSVSSGLSRHTKPWQLESVIGWFLDAMQRLLMPDSLPALLTLCSRPDIDSVNARLIDNSFVYWLRAEVQSQGFTCKWPCASVIFLLACGMIALKVTNWTKVLHQKFTFIKIF